MTYGHRSSSDVHAALAEIVGQAFIVVAVVEALDLNAAQFADQRRRMLGSFQLRQGAGGSAPSSHNGWSDVYRPRSRLYDPRKRTLSSMTASAVYGFIGVLLGSATTAVLTVYHELVASRRERDAREHQRVQERQDQRDTFQRQSLLALQDAVSDLVKAVFNEQDRMLEEMQRTGNWPARQWETPTATGWEDAKLRLQVSRARVFDEELRDLAREIHAVAKESVWASSLDEAKDLNSRLEQGHQRFNDLVARALPGLY